MTGSGVRKPLIVWEILTENILNIKKSFINGSQESRVLSTYLDKQYKQDSMEKETL